ncbi:MAG: arginine N-succinyltransferase [Opitutaceae bacterium]|nr:arginine N-succinyltransferase [Opitutaceae bacterium]
MLVLRPIREPDLPGLIALAQATGGGLTTLPPDEWFLTDRIDESLRAFRPRVRQPGSEYYPLRNLNRASQIIRPTMEGRPPRRPRPGRSRALQECANNYTVM